MPSPISKLTLNPLGTHADLLNYLLDLLDPLMGCQSAGCARIRLSTGGTHFDQVAAELEGYARALWGIVPALVG